MAKNANKTAVVEEAARWVGVRVSFEEKRRHLIARLEYEGRERFVVIPRTSSDWRSSLNTVADMRRELRTLGATRKDGKHEQGSRARIVRERGCTA